MEKNPMLDGKNQNPSCVFSIDINEPHYFMEAFETHLFHCTHGGEWIISHDAIQDAFVYIVRNTGFHV
jgi:hypothetical protein